MKTFVAPTGRITRKTKTKPISDAQRRLLGHLYESPGLDLDALTARCGYQHVSKTELAIQGLVQRGLVQWTPGKEAEKLSYHVTPQGFTLAKFEK